MVLLRVVLLALVALCATASALPVLACAPSCQVYAAGVAYAPAAVVVESGARVTFHALDTKHTATSPTCFHVGFGPEGAGGIGFEVRDDQLWVRHDGRDLTHCASAQRVDEGHFVVTYHCLDHPGHVAGRVVVLAP